MLDFAGLGFALFLTLVGALLVLETDLVRGNGRILFAFFVLNTVLPIIVHSLYVNDLRLSSVRSCVDSWSILSIKSLYFGHMIGFVCETQVFQHILGFGCVEECCHKDRFSVQTYSP